MNLAEALFIFIAACVAAVLLTLGYEVVLATDNPGVSGVVRDGFTVLPR